MKSNLKKCFCSTLAGLVVCGAFCIPTHAAKADESNSENRYYDGPSISYAGDLDETITFSRKEEENVELPNAVPTYYSSDLANACGPIAGANIVGYYDKYYEDLIPNYTAYYTANGRYRRPDTTYVPALMQSLYTLMQTNVVDVGVSVTECLTGLQSYVVSKNRNITYTDIKTSTFNATACKNAFANMQPVLLFCSSASLYYMAPSETQDEVLYVLTSGTHIVVAYGYRTIRYYDANNINFRTDHYLKVSTGWMTHGTGLLKLNDIGWMDDAYIVNIT